MSQYPTNLTDKQWQVTENILDPQHRKRKYSLRDIMDATPFSILIAYRSIWLEIFAIRLIPTFSKTKGTDISQLTDKMIEEIEWK